MSEQELTEPQGVTETPVQEEAPPRIPGSRLYNQNLEAFRRSIEESLEGGLNRYGFAMFHSLPPEELALRREELGLEPQCAEEYYNLGCAYAQSGNLASALKCWQKALDLDSDLPEAIFNTALALEKQGGRKEAAKLYRRYLELVHNPDERSEIESHLASLES